MTADHHTDLRTGQTLTEQHLDLSPLGLGQSPTRHERPSFTINRCNNRLKPPA
jgi:hypothetical protein